MIDTPRKLLSETLGTMLLLAVVIGSGIMGERLSGGNVAVALLANTLATVGGLYVLIEVFGPVSGAHFNPAVSLVMAFRGELPVALLVPYGVAQLFGAMLGAWLAHAMFDMNILQFSTHVRSGVGQWIAEAVATAGLLLVILRAPAARVAAMVACYIGAAYWLLRRPRSRTRPRLLGGCSATASPGSRPVACSASCWPRWSAQALGLRCMWPCSRAWPRRPHPNPLPG